VEHTGNFLRVHFPREQAVHEVEGFGLTQMNVIPEGEMRHIARTLYFELLGFHKSVISLHKRLI
jgi:hypothetical protein